MTKGHSVIFIIDGTTVQYSCCISENLGKVPLISNFYHPRSNVPDSFAKNVMRSSVPTDPYNQKF